MDTLAPDAPAAATALPPELAPAPAAPCFVPGRARSRTVPLDWPIAYDGRTYDRVTVHRPRWR